MSGKEAMEEVIEDKIIHSYLWDKLFKKEMITEPLPRSYYYEDYSTLFMVCECRKGGVASDFALSLPSEKGKYGPRHGPAKALPFLQSREGPCGVH